MASQIVVHVNEENYTLRSVRIFFLHKKYTTFSTDFLSANKILKS
jgi:hypothetical protein